MIPMTERLRSILFVIYLYTSMTMVGIVFLPAWLMGRRQIAYAMRAWAFLMIAGLRAIMGVRVEVRGREFIPDQPCLIACKHQSMFETVALFAVIKDPAFVMKQELFWQPVFGWYAWRTGQLPVDRSAHALALKGLIRRAKRVIAQKRSIIIFPEGTRQKLNAVPDYKPGVAGLYRNLDLICVPAALNSGQCWPAKGFWRRKGKIIVEFLPNIEPGLKSKEFMSLLQDRIESATAGLMAENAHLIGQDIR